MDLQHFGIDERLLAGAPGLSEQAPFHEKMLSHAVQKGENVCAKILLGSGRESVVLLPALQWMSAAAGVSGEERMTLCVLPDSRSALDFGQAARALGLGLGLRVATALENGLEGEAQPDLVTGSVDCLLKAQAEGLLALDRYGFLVIDGGETIAELAPDLLRRFQTALKPAWERRTVIACRRISVRAKNLAWDIAENPVEIQIEEDATKAQSVTQESWHIAPEAKLRFLLGLLARLKPAHSCVFCNLKPGAEELSLRLRHNGVEAFSILGPLSAERRQAILEEFEAEQGSVLVLTDEGSAGLPLGRLPLVVNYDIPLEPELYVKRLEMLARRGGEERIVNLACDRYVFGLPAIERHIDAKLDAKPAPADLLLAEDRSASYVFEPGRGEMRGLPRPGQLVVSAETGREGPPRGERRSAPPPRDRAEAGRQGQGAGRRARGGEESRRGSPDRQGRGERSDRSPDIQRSIAEATGGSLDVSGHRQPPPTRRPEGGSQPETKRAEGGGDAKKDGRERREGQKGGAQARSSGRDRREGGSQAAGGKAGAAKKTRSEGRAQRPAQNGRAAANGGAAANGRATQNGRAAESRATAARPLTDPYAMSTEERMRLYKEKYSGNGRPPKGAGAAQPRPQDKAKPAEGAASQRRQPPKQGSAEGRAPSPAARPQEPRPQEPRPQEPRQPGPTSGGASPKKGLLARLFGRGREGD
jgi:ATP-dependent RNA helicase RhlB